MHRLLARHGHVTPEPAKRPKSSYIRFAAEQPNETWQSDVTHYRLATGKDVEVITWLDDHSRYALRGDRECRPTALAATCTTSSRLSVKARADWVASAGRKAAPVAGHLVGALIASTGH